MGFSTISRWANFSCADYPQTNSIHTDVRDSHIPVIAAIWIAAEILTASFLASQDAGERLHHRCIRVRPNHHRDRRVRHTRELRSSAPNLHY